MVPIKLIIMATLVPAIVSQMCRWIATFLKNQDDNNNLKVMSTFLMLILEHYSVATWVTTFPIILLTMRFADWLWYVAVFAWITNFVAARPYFRIVKTKYDAGYNWELNPMAILMYVYLIYLLI